MIYRDVARKLVALGCQELARRSGGSHRKWLNPDTQRAAVLSDWGARDLKLGTVPSSEANMWIRIDAETFCC
ncbi:MAG: type II toxin-antitoxin system HicA family toxin [Pirellulaceae bacterium]